MVVDDDKRRPTNHDFVTLREHLESQLRSLEKTIEARIASLEKAVVVAHDVMERRLTSMNEFRETLKDQAAKFITRGELGILIDPLIEDVRNLREAKAQLEGKASQTQLHFTMFLAVLGIVIAALQVIMH